MADLEQGLETTQQQWRTTRGQHLPRRMLTSRTEIGLTELLAVEIQKAFPGVVVESWIVNGRQSKDKGSHVRCRDFQARERLIFDPCSLNSAHPPPRSISTVIPAQAGLKREAR